MLKIAAGLAALLAAAGTVSSVTFERDAVRIGDAAVTESSLQFRETPEGALLAGRDAVESLSGRMAVNLGDGRTVTIPPGVRLARRDGGWRLSTHGRPMLTLSAGGSLVEAQAPVDLTPAGDGWTLADGRSVAAKSFEVLIPETVAIEVADTTPTASGPRGGNGGNGRGPALQLVAPNIRTNNPAVNRGALEAARPTSPFGR